MLCSLSFPENMIILVVGTLLCLSYVIINYFATIKLIAHFESDLNVLKKPNLFRWGQFYAVLMSLPVMPFVHHGDGTEIFGITIVSLFALSHFIWQTLWYSLVCKFDVKKIFIPVSLANLAAWMVMAFLNCYAYQSFANFAVNVFIP